MFPLAAVIVARPAAPGAVSRPPEAIVPAVAVQVNAGWTARTRPNWSSAKAPYCCVPPTTTDALPGVTVMLVSVWLTVTVTLLLTERPAPLVMVAVNLYVPAARKVTVVRWAALLPLILKVGAETPLGSDAVNQVYLRLWPAASLPRTESCAVVPVTALDDAAAAVATVGA